MLEEAVISGAAAKALAAEEKIDFNKQGRALGWEHKIQTSHIDARGLAKGAGHALAERLFFRPQIVVDASPLGYVVIETSVSDPEVALHCFSYDNHPEIHALVVHIVLEQNRLICRQKRNAVFKLRPGMNEKDC